MKKKSQNAPRKGTLVDCELVEITDPAELAELERRCREAEKLLPGRAEIKKARNKSPMTNYKPTLVEYELVEITDLDEQADLDRRCREAEKLFAQRDKMFAEILAANQAKLRKRK